MKLESMPPQLRDTSSMVAQSEMSMSELDQTIAKMHIDHPDRIVESTSAVVPPASNELARNLPTLIEQLQLLRSEMEKCSKVYDKILNSDDQHSPSKQVPPNYVPNHDDDAVGERQSIFTPFEYERQSMLERGSVLSTREGSAAATNKGNSTHTTPNTSMADDLTAAFDAPPPAAPIIFRTSSKRSMQLQRLPRPSVRIPTVVRNIDYSVMWVSGECGISLRNFSANKIGAQIAVLQQAEGVTTGIANCRLGDQLVTVNDDKVEDMRFKDIVHKLKTTRRPISLGFRTNPNVHTSPTAASGLANHQPYTGLNSRRRRGSTDSRASVSSASSNRFTTSTSVTSSVFFPEDSSSSSIVESMRLSRGVSGGSTTYWNDLPSVDRQTNGSVQSTSSSTSTLSDDVEMWCKEQEEMHSELLVLLTETVLRCEKLKQENLDQLQSLMQLAPNLYSGSTPLPRLRNKSEAEQADVPSTMPMSAPTA